jgi:hypothetical protein
MLATKIASGTGTGSSAPATPTAPKNPSDRGQSTSMRSSDPGGEPPLLRRRPIRGLRHMDITALLLCVPCGYVTVQRSDVTPGWHLRRLGRRIVDHAALGGVAPGPPHRGWTMICRLRLRAHRRAISSSRGVISLQANPSCHKFVRTPIGSDSSTL